MCVISTRYTGQRSFLRVGELFLSQIEPQANFIGKGSIAVRASAAARAIARTRMTMITKDYSTELKFQCGRVG